MLSSKRPWTGICARFAQTTDHIFPSINKPKPKCGLQVPSIFFSLNNPKTTCRSRRIGIFGLHHSRGKHTLQNLTSAWQVSTSSNVLTQDVPAQFLLVETEDQ